MTDTHAGQFNPNKPGPPHIFGVATILHDATILNEAFMWPSHYGQSVTITRTHFMYPVYTAISC